MGRKKAKTNMEKYLDALKMVKEWMGPEYYDVIEEKSERMRMRMVDIDADEVNRVFNNRCDEWVTVEGYPNYEVNLLMQVRNKRTGQILKGTDIVTESGEYKYVTLYSWNGNRRVNVRQLISIAFFEGRLRGKIKVEELGL